LDHFFDAFSLYNCHLCRDLMPLGFRHQRTFLPLLRGSSSYALSTLLNGRIVHATRLQVANASRFARRVNSGKLPTAKVPENAPQTVESWSSRASVPPQRGSWKSAIILLYLAGPCVRALSHVQNKLTQGFVDRSVHIFDFETRKIRCRELGDSPGQESRG